MFQCMLKYGQMRCLLQAKFQPERAGKSCIQPTFMDKIIKAMKLSVENYK